MILPSSIATRLQYQHKCLLDIIEGLSDEQIRLHANPGKWSIFETVVHLQVYQHAMIQRVRKILEEANPSFERYRAEADPLFTQNCQASSREILADLLSVRKEMAAEILAFKEDDFSRKGRHPVYGNLSLVEWLNFFLLHEAHHLFEIFKTAATLKPAR